MQHGAELRLRQRARSGTQQRMLACEHRGFLHDFQPTLPDAMQLRHLDRPLAGQQQDQPVRAALEQRSGGLGVEGMPLDAPQTNPRSVFEKRLMLGRMPGNSPASQPNQRASVAAN